MAQAGDERVGRFRREALPALLELYRPSKVLVFGSRARGEALKHSDLDLVIVSDAFRDVAWLDRAVRVIEDCDVRFGVELLCYTPEEYEQKREELGIVRTASREGIDLLATQASRPA
ncbi:MAG: nucleotidyltransferase domain-containing protein [Gemmatimonadota bacterium]